MRPIKPDIKPDIKPTPQPQSPCVCKTSNGSCTSPACQNKKPEAYLFTSTWTAKCQICRKTVGVKCSCTESERDCYYLGLADATGRKGRGWRDIAADICIFGLVLAPFAMAAAGMAWLIKML